jgi:mono/diheme cytochrome c family protein
MTFESQEAASRRGRASRSPARTALTSRSAAELAQKSRVRLAIASALVLSTACTRPGGPDLVTTTQFPYDAGPPPVVRSAVCAAAQSSQLLPARSTVVGATGTDSAANSTYFTSDLFNLFRSVCGGCHVDESLGNFNVTPTSFSRLPATVLPSIETDDLAVVMPPGPVPYSQRQPTDPVVQLATLLQTWIDQGKPDGTFTLSAPNDQAASGDYRMPPVLSAALTNIGSCIPNQDAFAANTTTMNSLDAFFSQATALPDNIGETDLTTLDSQTLAQNGVVSFAPGYPLWWDDAKNLRHVRVPLGQSVTFDKDSQQFQIPPNTRFYDTFFKKVVDASGNQAYRKIETRVIVSRPDQTLTDGIVEHAALYGAYIWNDDESDAHLLKDPLRDGEPFRDRVLSYITDEPRAQAIMDSHPQNVDYALTIENPGVVRHYAVPGSDLCEACHMGSPSRSFVLGFTPLQLARRPTGMSGTLEPAAGDELTQLQRLIDLGVISGMTSPDDVVPLERSQGARRPRNDYELTAQAYMVGNCAHCHNPRGDASFEQPALKDVLNFMPGPDGGIFQFSLETGTPLRPRGVNHDVPIPYITPSLRDNPLQDGKDSKWVACEDDPLHFCRYPTEMVEFVSAPWRSLIYRAVDTPFDYVEDYTIFPAMPANIPGHDCRSARIFGDWMVSIPAVLKHPNLSEDAVLRGNNNQLPANANTDAQPYREVTPDDPKWGQGLFEAQERLAEYHAGHRYTFCPQVPDIVDPLIEDAVNNGLPVVLDTDSTFDPSDPTKLIMPDTGVPIRPHWVIEDDTDAPGDWVPRRPDWAGALIDHVPDSFVGSAADVQTYADVVAGLADPSVRVDPATRAALLQELSFGIWVQKPGCDLSAMPTAGSYQSTDRPAWMNVSNPAATARVYTQTAGEAIFNTICLNCHGPNADSGGLLANEIAVMTAGDARVANLSAGLFGPDDDPGANRLRVFGPAAAADPSDLLTADDIGARYMAWMALGGTTKHLPSTLLGLAASTPVLGVTRNGSFISPKGTPNMLQLGLDLCTQVVVSNYNVQRITLDTFFAKGAIDWSQQTALVDVNGDAELWLRLCSLNNRPVVRVPLITPSAALSPASFSLVGWSLYWGDTYPATSPVMDHHGRLYPNGITADNPFPICVPRPADAVGASAMARFLNANPIGGAGGNPVPFCPDALLSSSNKLAVEQQAGTTTYPDAEKWAARGAINAGLAVFVYVDQLVHGLATPKPPYDHCELLNQAP